MSPSQVIFVPTMIVALGSLALAGTLWLTKGRSAEIPAGEDCFLISAFSLLLRRLFSLLYFGLASRPITRSSRWGLVWCAYRS